MDPKIEVVELGPGHSFRDYELASMIARRVASELEFRLLNVAFVLATCWALFELGRMFQRRRARA